MSIKKDLVGEQFVKGNMRILQSYNIFYYPPEHNFPTDKIWIYLHGTENKKPRTIRSLCFENPENHRKFILNNIYANLYILEKRLISYSDIQMSEEYRKRLLDGLLSEIRKDILNRWKKEMEEKCLIQKNNLMNIKN